MFSKRVSVLLAMMAVMVMVASGVALAVTKIGGPGNDVLVGTNDHDKLDGRGGNDTIYARASNDEIQGWYGNDTISAGAGADWGTGGYGNDIIDLGPGDDGLPFGFLVLDLEFYGGPGDDVISGGAGDDVIVGDYVVCPVPPSPGKCVGADRLAGQDGNDDLAGSLGPDTISGGPGNDSLYDGENAGGARDVLSGGDGNDFLSPFNDPARRDIVSCGAGTDEVAADAADLVASDCEKVMRS